MSKKPPNRPGISFEVGAKIEAQDYLKKWYPAHIVELESEEGNLLVHFERWSHRYDEWISWDSSRLRPLDTPALCKEGQKEDDDKTEMQGGEVLARWTDCRYYPAKIEAVNKDGSYRVQFYDGVVRSIKRVHIKSMPEDAKGQDWVALVKAATVARSSKPRTSNNSSRCRPEEEEETEEEDEEDEEEEGGEDEQKESDPAQMSSPTAGSGCVSDVISAGEDSQSASETTPLSGPDNRINSNTAFPSSSQRRRSQRLATTSDLTFDPSNPEDPTVEREESGHHNYCAEVPPTTPAQPITDHKQPPDSSSANHTTLSEKSPPIATVVGLKSSAVRTRTNRHTREPIMSSLRGPDVLPCPSEDSSQFQCPVSSCSKAFRKAKLLEYHLKYYHSHTPSPHSHTPSPHSHTPSPHSHTPSPHSHTPSSHSHTPSSHSHTPSSHSHTPSPHREGRTRAISTSLPASCSPPHLLEGRRRRTVSSSASVSLQMDLVARCGKRKRLSASISSDSTSPLPFPPLPPSTPPPRELGLEPLHHNLLRSTLEPGFIRMEKRIKMEDRHLGSGRKKERRGRRERDTFKVKLKKKKKKKKKSKQHSYHDYDDLSLTFLERSSLLHHHGNSFSLLPSSSSSSSSKHLFPRALLQVDLTGENLSEGEFLEDSTTESLLHSGEELELDDGMPEDLSETSQEIVRCVCQMDEENGFMIQCEECMCWQHSVCMGLLEDSIPDQYICYICRDPPGQRWSARYRHNRDWLVKGHMFGLSILSENYSEQNSQRIVSTHQLLADLLSLKHLLHSLSLKMDILQDCHSPSLQLWARSWVNSDEHQPMGGLPDCLHFLDHMTNPSPPLSPLPRPSPSQTLTDTYITSEHSYQKPPDPTHNPQPTPRSDPAPGSDSTPRSGPVPCPRRPPCQAAECVCSSSEQEQCVVALESRGTAGDTVDLCRSPDSLLGPAHHVRTRTRACVQWQMNLLTHIEDVQNQLASRMDLIEKELDVLESWLDLSGGLEPPDPLARLPQLKLSIKQLLADLGKLQHISALCSV